MKRLPLLLIPMIAIASPMLAQNAVAQAATDQPIDQGSSAQAYDAGPAPDTQDAPQQRPHGHRFRDADTNGDGKLSRAEAQAMPFVAKHFDAIDTNHDGYISHAEMRAARQRMHAARAQQAASSSGS